MDRNTIFGFVLIAAVLIGFTIWSQPSEKEIAQQKEEARKNAQVAAQTIQAEKNASDPNKAKTEVNNFFTAVATAQSDSVQTVVTNDSLKTPSQVEPKIVTLENSKVKIDISTQGGQIQSAQLKEYTDYKYEPLYLFDGDGSFNLTLTNAAGKHLNTTDLNFTPIATGDSSSIIMRFIYSDNQYIDFVYELDEDDYMVKYNIRLIGMEDLLDRRTSDMFHINWAQDMRRQEESIKNEQRYSRIYYKYVGDNVKELSESKNDNQEITEPSKWIAFKNQFFASILIANDEFGTVVLDSKVKESNNYLKSCSADIYSPVTYDAANKLMTAGYRFYFGPMSYSLLKQYDDQVTDKKQQLDLDELIPLGWTLFRWINQYFVIPLFNLLTSSGLSMGIVILLLTVIVKLIISPLTYKSFISSAKMRVLKPQVEEIGAKYPKPEQAAEKQRAVMALYSSAGANPMSGCLPMLLQMPVLLALFAFFPNAIELRHKSFLWAKDLSTYDAIIHWDNSIPLIGNHLSLFCILMTITNIIYTKFNMEATNTGQQQMPGMKWMMLLMPVVFLFVLNDYPSGLTYYYFVSTLITILLTLAFRYTVNEEKLLAKLEANKSKPKKKSGFMARLEEAQRMQQQQLREQNKKGGKKNKR